MLYSAWNQLRKLRPQVSEAPVRRDAPARETRCIWFWNDKKQVMDGYWTDGPPPGFWPNFYHSNHQQQRDWLFPRGHPYSSWDGRAR